MSIFDQFNDAKDSQVRSTDTGARQTVNRYTLSDVGEAKIAEAVETYGLEARPAVVAKVDGMRADFQAPKGGKGLSVYANGTVVARGLSL